ncbi:MAG TPA: hypothetical protein VH107_07980, partial [Lacipirellulaceae bacterium]|nr:hypothetical protein [Lacipirellulaceae bacterium]
MFACIAGVSWSAGKEVIAQAPSPVASVPVAGAPAQLPELIYWKQHLFLIPYKWASAAEPAAAQVVILYVSKDRGASWQKISEAKPQVRAFNYRAEGDGEYWFAVRTLDNRGQSLPAGAFQAELRVVVDTTIPRIEELRARPTATGAIDIQCRATDVNLDPASLKVESQVGPGGLWQVVPLQPAGATSPVPSIHALWQPAPGMRPLAIRATIADRAGNSTVYQTPVETTPLMSGPALSQPGMGPMATGQAAPQLIAAPPVLNTSPTAMTPASVMPVAPPLGTVPAAPATQPWPAGATARTPFQLWTSGTAAADDGVTSYGSPNLAGAATAVGTGPALGNLANDDANHRVPAQFASAVKNPESGWTSASTANGAGPQFAPLEPFRQTTTSAAPAAAVGPALVPISSTTNVTANASITPIDTPPPTHRPTTQPKLVGSRTFALEYDLDDAGRDGVSRVELWGTRDGGQNWNRYAVDDDNRSPLVVTVDSEGLYGFKILVQSASGGAVNPPRSGDEPELWVSVDLKRPIVELTSIERGQGNLSDH